MRKTYRSVLKYLLVLLQMLSRGCNAIAFIKNDGLNRERYELNVLLKTSSCESWACVSASLRNPSKPFPPLGPSNLSTSARSLARSVESVMDSPSW